MNDKGDRRGGRRRARADFRFDDARLCFALAGTLAHRGTDTPFERLTRPEDLGRWSVQSGCTTVAPACTEADPDHAGRLREAIRRTGQALADETAPAHEDIALINSAAAEPTPCPNSRPTRPPCAGTGTASRQCSPWPLSMAARDLIDLCRPEHRTSVRICANPACGTPFVDTSRAGARRWCSMKRRPRREAHLPGQVARRVLTPALERRVSRPTSPRTSTITAAAGEAPTSRFQVR